MFLKICAAASLGLGLVVACGSGSEGSGPGAEDGGGGAPGSAGAPSPGGASAGSESNAGSPGVEGDLEDSSDSVTISQQAGRADPEGVAATSPRTMELSWRDSQHALRTMSLYGYLYQYDFSFLGGVAGDPEEVTERSVGDDAWGHAGFGYVVSHNTQTGNSPLGKANEPTRVETTAFVGGHHAIHRVELVYDRDQEGGGEGIAIPVVIEWLVATGRDHPVWSVTWKVSDAENPNGVDFDAYRMDVRGPYGSLNFDGAGDKGEGDAVGGVSWGDFELAFATTGAELSLASPWTYDTPNTVNYSHAWTKTVNAEMGIVQTVPGDKSLGYGDYVVGRLRGQQSAAAYPSKGDCNAFGDARVYSMPCVNGWPYQLMNYDWDAGAAKPIAEGTGTKLMAWGSPYGWLGASSYDLFDYSGVADGRGDRSYATFVVLGPKCRYEGAQCSAEGDVALVKQAVDALGSAKLEQVTRGKVTASIAAGPGAAQLKKLVSGYNDTYAAYYVEASDGGASFTFAPAAGKPVDKPIFVLQNVDIGNRPEILVGGEPRAVNTGDASSGAFVSYSPERRELWITLNETFSQAKVVSILP
ncbi:MAG: hypothetical protein EOO73_30545 [Myxococcales bacterium]|nr:MAG: hypothetical protein EOO73_30545 [Myxococcales bacterium]